MRSTCTRCVLKRTRARTGGGEGGGGEEGEGEGEGFYFYSRILEMGGISGGRGVYSYSIEEFCVRG
jgi:hypothetical protein